MVISPQTLLRAACNSSSLVFAGAAVVFVIDSCHRDRLMEAHSELAKLLTEKELRDALLLIFANKQVHKDVVTCDLLLGVRSPLGWSLRRTSPAPCRWRR